MNEVTVKVAVQQVDGSDPPTDGDNTITLHSDPSGWFVLIIPPELRGRALALDGEDMLDAIAKTSVR